MRSYWHNTHTSQPHHEEARYRDPARRPRTVAEQERVGLEGLPVSHGGEQAQDRGVEYEAGGNGSEGSQRDGLVRAL